MQLGIANKTAIVCASSRGLGFACADALARGGVQLIINGLDATRLAQSDDTLRGKHNAQVTPVVADITSEAGRKKVLAEATADGRVVDILVNNAGGPPPGDFRDWQRDDWLAAVNANMLTPIEMIKAVLDGMIDQGFGRIVNITSGAVRAPIPHLGLSNAARSGLTGFVAGLARQVAQHNVTINNLLPGQFNTDRVDSLFAARAKAEGVAVAEIRKKAETANPSRRLGSPHEFGAACAFLCGVDAGYIVGQNILIDGGASNANP